VVQKVHLPLKADVHDNSPKIQQELLKNLTVGGNLSTGDITQNITQIF
jgi:hypothetical protein